VPLERNPNFVGRDVELDQLDEKLFLESRCSRAALIGLGGVGKTQIALELAYRARDKYPECSIFWLPSMNSESLRRAYQETGRQLCIEGLRKENADVKRLVQHHLSQDSAGQWLMIFDNADDMGMWMGNTDSDGKGDSLGLVDYLPSSSQGSI